MKIRQAGFWLSLAFASGFLVVAIDGLAQPEVSLTQLLQEAVQSFNNISSFSADITIKSTTRKTKGRPERTRTNLRIAYKNIRTDTPSILVINKDTNDVIIKIFEGSPVAGNAPESVLRIRAARTFKYIQPIFLGRILEALDLLSIREVSPNSVEAVSDGEFIKYLFKLDVEENLIRTVLVSGTFAGASTKYRFSEYFQVGGIIFPKIILVNTVSNGSSSRTTNEYSEVLINHEIPDELFQ